MLLLPPCIAMSEPSLDMQFRYKKREREKLRRQMGSKELGKGKGRDTVGCNHSILQYVVVFVVHAVPCPAESTHTLCFSEEKTNYFFPPPSLPPHCVDDAHTLRRSRRLHGRKKRRG